MRKIVYCKVLAFLITSTIIITGISSQSMITLSPVLASHEPKQNVTLAVVFNDFNNHQGKLLLDSAIDKLRSNHPNLNINVKYVETSDRPVHPATLGTHDELLKAITNRTSTDIATIVYIYYYIYNIYRNEIAKS